MTDKPEGYIPPHQVQILYPVEEISRTIHRLAIEIREKLGDEFTLVALLKGSFVFTADLVRALHAIGCAPQIDFMTLASYGKNKVGSATISVQRDLSEEVKGKRVLIVDDILESGRTLHYARHLLMERGALETHICVLMEKPGKRVADGVDADFTGFVIPDRFVVGYGLDYANYYRELPFIGALD
jgi:hypoxanthine phosphoribosyltransferase